MQKLKIDRPRKSQEDRYLTQLPLIERKRQIAIRQAIAREYMGLPPLPHPGRPALIHSKH